MKEAKYILVESSVIHEVSLSLNTPYDRPGGFCFFSQLRKMGA
jgi:hypothetical protein